MVTTRSSSSSARPCFITGILLYVIYVERRKIRAASVKECPDCLETVKRAARVCRYCGYRWPEEQQSEQAPKS
jgi:ribosomal protein L32